ETIAAHYPEARRLQQIKGVGPVTALAFVLLIEDPSRFSASREVGAYFGLVPRLDESSDSTPQLRITKAGDELGRRLLVGCHLLTWSPVYHPPCLPVSLSCLLILSSCHPLTPTPASRIRRSASSPPSRVTGSEPPGMRVTS